MNRLFAHIWGVPLEETLPTLIPMAFVFAMLVRTRLREIGAWRRHR